MSPRGSYPRRFDRSVGTHTGSEYITVHHSSHFPFAAQDSPVQYSTVFFFFICFWHFHNFLLSPLTEVSPQQSAIPGGNPPEDWQSAVSWGGAGFEPGTAGLQSAVLPLSHHAIPIEPPRHPIEPPRHPNSTVQYSTVCTWHLEVDDIV
jgi:hypothetical protein